jgi:hypothetical protein
MFLVLISFNRNTANPSYVPGEAVTVQLMGTVVRTHYPRGRSRKSASK